MLNTITNYIFYRDIIKHPNDLILKLIYADWLEDNGFLARANEIRDNSVYKVNGAYKKNGFYYRFEIDYQSIFNEAFILFNTNPIQEIYITNMHPLYSPWDQKYYYYSHWIHSKVRHHMLNPMVYYSEMEAIDNLNKACLKYGRSLIE